MNSDTASKIQQMSKSFKQLGALVHAVRQQLQVNYLNMEFVIMFYDNQGISIMAYASAPEYLKREEGGEETLRLLNELMPTLVFRCTETTLSIRTAEAREIDFEEVVKMMNSLNTLIKQITVNAQYMETRRRGRLKAISTEMKKRMEQVAETYGGK